MYQTNQNNMMLEFDTPGESNFISVENTEQQMNIIESVEPEIKQNEAVELKSMDQPMITPSIQNEPKSSPQSYSQTNNSNKAMAPANNPPKSRGFDSKLGANSQLPSQSKSSGPRFGMETRMNEVSSVPDWRRLYM